MAQRAVQPAGASDRLVARASTEYRVKRFIIVAMLVGMGLWFGYDGFINWPRENARIAAIGKEIEAARKANDDIKVTQLDAERNNLKQHTETDLRMQRVLAFSLPPVGLIILGWSLYRSRGAYRLIDGLLNVPGHPPIPLDAIRAIDKTDWDRKGIVYINYELVNGAKGSACLDDFIYERKGTDDIFKRIEDLTDTAPQTADDIIREKLQGAQQKRS